MKQSKTWLVTGASKGLGLVLVKKLLEQGSRVAATSRNLAALVTAIGEPSSQFLPLQMDLEDENNVAQGIEKTIAHFGNIDVIVNNAGYGQIGALEELSDKEARSNFDVNVFGLLNVIRKATPHLRAQGAGHIFNIASIGGYNGGFAGWGIYCGTKFAVAGLTAALAAELQPLGIHATVVYPGYFRTSFLSAGSIGTPANPIAAYEAVRASQLQHQEEINNNQPGDPEKAAAVMIAVAAAAQPPVHLFLGNDAYNMAGVKDAYVKQEMETWRALATATDIVE